MSLEKLTIMMNLSVCLNSIKLKTAIFQVFKRKKTKRVTMGEINKLRSMKLMNKITVF